MTTNSSCNRSVSQRNTSVETSLGSPMSWTSKQVASLRNRASINSRIGFVSSVKNGKRASFSSEKVMVSKKNFNVYLFPSTLMFLAHMCSLSAFRFKRLSALWK
mgnify:CR=1 FL=1